MLDRLAGTYPRFLKYGLVQDLITTFSRWSPDNLVLTDKNHSSWFVTDWKSWWRSKIFRNTSYFFTYIELWVVQLVLAANIC